MKKPPPQHSHLPTSEVPKSLFYPAPITKSGKSSPFSRRKSIAFKVTKDEFRVIQREARRAKSSASNFIRQAILLYIGNTN